MKKRVFERIQDVLREAHRPLAAHEFQNVFLSMPVDHLEGGRVVDGRYYVGCSESSLSRQLRRMRELKLVTATIREGKSFNEYKLAPRAPVQGFLDLGAL